MIPDNNIYKVKHFYYSLLSTTTAFAVLRLLLIFYLYFLALLLLVVLGEGLPTGDVLLVADFDAWMVSDLDLVQLDLVEGGLGEEGEDLLYIGAVLGRCLYKGYVSFLGET